MIYIFSSASRLLYRQDALDACCYPEGHVMRFRYSARLVQPTIRRSPALLFGKEVLVVFAASHLDQPAPNKPVPVGAANAAAPSDSSKAETSTVPDGAPGDKEKARIAAASADFFFLPIRRGRIADASFTADVLFVDVELGVFCDYAGADDSAREQGWDEAIKLHRERPHPPGDSTEGCFIYRDDPIDMQLPRDDDAAWKSVVERINRTNLADCLTYRVLGFYRLDGWWGALLSALGRLYFQTIGKLIGDGRGEKASETFAVFRRLRETRIRPTVKGPDCHYKFEMGETVALKMLFYRTDALAEKKILRLRYDQKAFTSASRDEFHIGSRYDEIRVLLSCARSPDPTYSALSVVQSGGGKDEDGLTIWAPQPMFVTLIRPPFLFLLNTVLMFTLGLYLLQLSAQDVQALAPQWANLPWFAAISKFPKALGTFFVFCATWRYVRKFPLK